MSKNSSYIKQKFIGVNVNIEANILKSKLKSTDDIIEKYMRNIFNDFVKDIANLNRVISNFKPLDVTRGYEEGVVRTMHTLVMVKCRQEDARKEVLEQERKRVYNENPELQPQFDEITRLIKERKYKREQRERENDDEGDR